MRDHGLNEAIRAAGGVGALARKIGIAQPSISGWTRVPADRVLAIEAATRIDRSLLLPYASYYLTGFLHERPLARLREQLATLGLERAPEQPEPEDHAGLLLEIMAGLAGGTLAATPGTDRALFEAHLVPWIGRFFSD